MGVFGDRLRREREMRGVTLEEISESTKISKRSLQAMEDEHFDLLPGGIFNKGFVRAYARFLGIDEEQAVADFLAVSNEQQAEDKFPLELQESEKQPSLNPRRSLLPIVLALLVLVAVAGAWTFWTKHKPQERAAEAQSAPADVPEHPATAPVTLPADPTNRAGSHAYPTTAGPNPTATPLADAPAGGSGSRTSPPMAEQPADRTSKPATPQPWVAPDATGKKRSSAGLSGDRAQSSSDPTPASREAFTVSVKATEDSWISIVADGKPRMEGILIAAKQQSVRAGRELVLVTGNAGGIEVSYNGKLVAPLGKKQQKRTVTFTPQGIQQ